MATINEVQADVHHGTDTNTNNITTTTTTTSHTTSDPATPQHQVKPSSFTDPDDSNNTNIINTSSNSSNPNIAGSTIITTTTTITTTNIPTIPQLRPGRSSLKKLNNTSNSSSNNSHSSRHPHHRQKTGNTQVEQRRVMFSRSRSLSECRTSSWSGFREGSTSEERRDSHSSQFCRVRSFKSTRKGLVRSGESFKSTDTKTFMSTGSVRVYRKLSMIGRSQSIESTDSSVGGSSVAESYYRVGVLGATGVGKSTLIHKFLASEEQTESSELCINPGETSTTQYVTVSVSLDGQESLLEFGERCEEDEENNPNQSFHSSTTTLTFIPPSDDVPDDVNCTVCQSDAYTIVFALNDVDSFRRAGSFLRHLREERGSDRAITLVGNKSDLVRQRHVSDKDACALANKYDCKYIETSAELGHQTDELLVGTLRQIRLKLLTSPEHDALDDGRMTSKKHLKWQKLIHLYRFLQGASQAMDSCQNFSV